MPIGPYLAGRTFLPEMINVMSAALDEVCKVLKMGGDIRSRATVARTIIALVEDGKTDADQLAAASINRMRGTEIAPS